MLFLNVTFYQYSLISAEFSTYRTYWHGDSVDLIYKHNNWTIGGSVDDKDEWERYEKALINTDIVICLPSVKKYRPVSNARNVTVARLLGENKVTDKIITFVCGYQIPETVDEDSEYFNLPCLDDGEDVLFCLNDLEKTFRKKLIDSSKYTDRFQQMFDNPDGGWVTGVKKENAAAIVKYFLTVETQRLLKEKKCYGGEIDGTYSFRTKEGLRKFQMLKLLPADGIPNREIWEILKQEG